MNGLNIGLEAVLPGRDRTMALSLDPLDRLGESRVVFGLPASDEFAAIVGLPGHAIEAHAAGLQVLDDPLGEERGVGESQFVGVAQEQEAGGDVACGVLVLRQAAALDRKS